MKAIIVDDEPIMIKSFMRLSSGISDITVVGQLNCGEDAIDFVKHNDVEFVFLDIVMPGMTGIETAKVLKEMKPGIIIVFISAFDGYVRDSNIIGGDYYIVKPYKREVLENTVALMKLVQKRQKKNIYMQTFGRFSVLVDGKPLNITGKAKEILALIVTKRGKEIGNDELYSIMWEDRPCTNDKMKVYYNALKRLKDTLSENGLSDLLISSARGQRINVEMFDCDYYNFLDNKAEGIDKFEGEFMSEYSWGEYLISEITEWYEKNKEN